ncbi:hypothetical protein HDU86_006404 [Geranomyces michiganensis]|nr:hypothetical protein HDU86_006404 [Geranomyces michiganensis]
MASSILHGNLESVKGSVNKTLGAATGNQSLYVKGAAQHAAGVAEVETIKAANYSAGAADAMGGAIKEHVGHFLGNERMQAEGATTRAKGELRKELNKQL